MTALERFNTTGYPVLIGASRKRFVGAALADAGIDKPNMDSKDNATAAISAYVPNMERGPCACMT